jgi:hypothetical protein
MKLIKWLLSRLFSVQEKKKRVELRFVTYSEGDRLIKLNEGWKIAKEEDDNHKTGWVYLEKVELYDN